MSGLCENDTGKLLTQLFHRECLGKLIEGSTCSIVDYKQALVVQLGRASGLKFQCHLTFFEGMSDACDIYKAY